MRTSPPGTSGCGGGRPAHRTGASTDRNDVDRLLGAHRHPHLTHRNGRPLPSLSTRGWSVDPPGAERGRAPFDKAQGACMRIGVMTVIKINAITVPRDSGDEWRIGSPLVPGRSTRRRASRFERSSPPTTATSGWSSRWRDEAAFQAWLGSESFTSGHRSAAERGTSARRDAQRGLVLRQGRWPVPVHASARRCQPTHTFTPPDTSGTSTTSPSRGRRPADGCGRASMARCGCCSVRRPEPATSDRWSRSRAPAGRGPRGRGRGTGQLPPPRQQRRPGPPAVPRCAGRPDGRGLRPPALATPRGGEPDRPDEVFGRLDAQAALPSLLEIIQDWQAARHRP